MFTVYKTFPVNKKLNFLQVLILVQGRLASAGDSLITSRKRLPKKLVHLFVYVNILSVEVASLKSYNFCKRLRTFSVNVYKNSVQILA